MPPSSTGCTWIAWCDRFALSTPTIQSMLFVWCVNRPSATVATMLSSTVECQHEEGGAPAAAERKRSNRKAVPRQRLAALL